MRLYTFLILIAVMTAFSAGYLSLSLYSKPLSVQESGRLIEQLKSDFRKNHTPAQELGFSALFPVGDPLQFLDSKLTFSQPQTFSFKELSRLYRFAASCQSKGSSPVTRDPTLLKAWRWLQFKCGQVTALPRDFFETSPFFFPLGGSYAFLATQEPKLSGQSPEWITQHLGFMNAAELKMLHRSDVALSPQLQTLSKLISAELKSISQGDEWVLAGDFIFYRKFGSIPTRGGETLGYQKKVIGYLAYPRQDWNRFVGRSPFSTEEATDDQLCLYQDGNICWKSNSSEALKTIWRPTLVLFFCAVLLAFGCVVLAIRKFQLQRKQEEKKRFALQTLTHELRTPLANLVLSSELLLDDFDSLPAATQGPLLRMCDDIRRLQRLTETSKQYLTSENEDSLIHFNFANVPSINAFLDDVLFPFKERGITVRYLAEDRGFAMDAYWVSVCVKNLVENAIQHGKPPVAVSVDVQDSELVIAVEDHGEWAFASLAEAKAPFTKSASSQGLGLGLTIVSKVAAAMNGKLEYLNHPTRLCLRVPKI
jgi:two-component sensor histidine kinase